jgi:hypothetical protein
VLSFGDLFFAQAKKSHSLAAASETKEHQQSVPKRDPGASKKTESGSNSAVG